MAAWAVCSPAEVSNSAPSADVGFGQCAVAAFAVSVRQDHLGAGEQDRAGEAEHCGAEQGECDGVGCGEEAGAGRGACRRAPQQHRARPNAYRQKAKPASTA
jgi:hypothetical protein